MSSLKVYEWNKKIKLAIVIILLIPVTAFLYIMIENYIFSNKIECIKANIKLGMHKSDVLGVIGAPEVSGYVTKQYETNSTADTVLSLAELTNKPVESYFVYNFGWDFFKKSDDLGLTFDSLDVLIGIKSPHF